MEKRSVPINGPLDLRRTLRPLHGHFADDGWWLAARTPDGPASMRVTRSRDELHGEAWGNGAPWMLSRLAFVGGLDDDPATFVTDAEIVAELHRRHPGLRFGRTDLIFDSLVVAICGQKVTGEEAHQAMAGLYASFADTAPGPHPTLRLPPDPERMADAPYHHFHELHLEKRRADLLRRVSRSWRSIESLRDREASMAAVALEGFPGIARWTSASTLTVSHGDSDQVAVGDFHLKHMVVHHLTGRDRGTDAEMLDLLEQFRPHRGRVVRLLHTLGHAPKFGPRLTPRNITRM